VLLDRACSKSTGWDAAAGLSAKQVHPCLSHARSPAQAPLCRHTCCHRLYVDACTPTVLLRARQLHGTCVSAVLSAGPCSSRRHRRANPGLPADAYHASVSKMHRKTAGSLQFGCAPTLGHVRQTTFLRIPRTPFQPMLPSPANRCQLNGVPGLHLAEDTTLSLRDVCFLVLIWLVPCVPGSSGARPQGAPPTQPGLQHQRFAAGEAGVQRSAGRGLGSGHSRPWLPTAPC
jgi:hypothetical protein